MAKHAAIACAQQTTDHEQEEMVRIELVTNRQGIHNKHQRDTGKSPERGRREALSVVHQSGIDDRTATTLYPRNKERTQARFYPTYSQSILWRFPRIRGDQQELLMVIDHNNQQVHHDQLDPIHQADGRRMF